jgi:putative transposase
VGYQITAVLATKSVKQTINVSLPLMETFRCMVNDCIRIGLENNLSTLKSLSKSCYFALEKYSIISYYKLHAIAKAAGILANRKQSIRRGHPTKTPYMRKAMLVSSYGFKIVDGVLKIPLGNRQYFDVPLNLHVRRILSDPSMTLRSFTLNERQVSICYSKEVADIECRDVEGVDRNLSNLSIATQHNAVHYDLTQTIHIAQNTRSVVRSFKRNDHRIREKLYRKYGKRKENRVNQILHHVSKHVVKDAATNKTAIAFEKLTNIRRLYQRGNYQGRSFRGKMNSWPFHEIKRQIQYKAIWEGVPIIELSSSQTRGTSQCCPQCGKRVQEAGYRDFIHKRQLWCDQCQKWMDRDVVAAMNIAKKGAEVFQRSKCDAGEAMKGNPTTPVILRVDASKLSFRKKA